MEGYDTEGYRIHGKSCDWDPMAGFVMRDPRLNKYGMDKAGFNRSKHKEAIEDDHEGQGWKASTTPLKISQSRINWLKVKGLIDVVQKVTGWTDILHTARASAFITALYRSLTAYMAFISTIRDLMQNGYRKKKAR